MVPKKKTVRKKHSLNPESRVFERACSVYLFILYLFSEILERCVERFVLVADEMWAKKRSGRLSHRNMGYPMPSRVSFILKLNCPYYLSSVIISQGAVLRMSFTPKLSLTCFLVPFFCLFFFSFGSVSTSFTALLNSHFWLVRGCWLMIEFHNSSSTLAMTQPRHLLIFLKQCTLSCFIPYTQHFLKVVII